MTRPLLRVIPLLLAVLYGAAATAQTAPNAGQLQRELQPPPDLAPPRTAPSLQNDARPPAAATGNAISIPVKTIRISGNTRIATETLHALVADLEGSSQSLDALNAAAARISAYYRQQGYPVTRVYLPPQEIGDGVVSIVVIEGRIGARKLENQSRLSDQRAAAYLDGVKDDEVIRTEQIDRGLLILNDTPGVGAARATLQPGASAGTSDLVVQLSPGVPYSGSVDIDNFGNRYVGEYRVGAALNLNSPLQIGDVLSFNVLTSGRGLNYARALYQLPIGADGLRVGAAFSDTVYRLGKEFSSLDAHGTATSTSLFAAYPFIRSQLANLNGTASLEQKKLSDSVAATTTTTDKQVDLASAGLQGGYQDGLGGGGFTGASLLVTVGRLNIQSASARAIDAASAQTDGHYVRLLYALNRLQRLGGDDILSLSVSGQAASKNLDSSEKFSLGGSNGVRAYPQGEAIGDSGYLATAEVRHNLGDAIQLIGFYDIGSVKLNKSPFGSATDNRRTLAGAGVGVNLSLADFRLRASLAWRTSSAQVSSIPSSAAQTPTVWVQASRGF